MKGLFLALVFLMPQATVGIQLDSGDWQTERLEQSRPLGENDTIEIRNEYGDIRCRAGAVEQVEVLSNSQRLKDDPLMPRIHIGQRDGRMVIEVSFVTDETRTESPETDEMKRRRVDLTVIMPAEARLVAHTRGGLIEAKGLEREMQADSLSGNIVVSTTATIRARTERGSIKLDLKSDQWEIAPSLETVTGNIEVWLPHVANLTISAETQGRITTDYSIDIRNEAKTKHISARIGKGGATLPITTIRGDVLIFRSGP